MWEKLSCLTLNHNEIHLIVKTNIYINFMRIQTVQWMLIKLHLPFISGNFKSIIII